MRQATLPVSWYCLVQAASLLGQVALLSRQHRDELAEALARVQKTLAASLFDAAPQTQYGERCYFSCFDGCLLPAFTGSRRSRPTSWLQASRLPAGALVGLSAFGAPVLMATVVPNLARYAQLLQVPQHTQHLQVHSDLCAPCPHPAPIIATELVSTPPHPSPTPARRPTKVLPQASALPPPPCMCTLLSCWH